MIDKDNNVAEGQRDSYTERKRMARKKGRKKVKFM